MQARRKAREQFLKHKPGNKFAVWELQTRLASDRNGGYVVSMASAGNISALTLNVTSCRWTPTPPHLNKELEVYNVLSRLGCMITTLTILVLVVLFCQLAYVRERSVHKFTTNGQMCIANFKAMEVENTISQRFTPLRRRLRNQYVWRYLLDSSSVPR